MWTQGEDGHPHTRREAAGRGPAHTSISDVQPPGRGGQGEDSRPCCVNHLVCGTALQQP